MNLLFGNNLGGKLALAALAMCFFAVPGKAQDTHKSIAEAPVCTSYPEWSCEPQATPSQKAASATTAQIDGPVCTSYPEWSCEPQATPSQKAASATTAQIDRPSCTSYPEWSCEPQTMPSQVRAKQVAGPKGREQKSKGAVSDSTGGLDETFERRP